MNHIGFGPIMKSTSRIWEVPRGFDKLSREFSQTELYIQGVHVHRLAPLKVNMQFPDV